ncbi:MAG TPA: hypothetical protein VEU30_03350, partial [Thermoanaerobaculia bacterium]|nr:hypothetical protein [Thermoanaerobaculia bacterium]
RASRPQAASVSLDAGAPAGTAAACGRDARAPMFVVALLLTLTASAETFGPVVIEPRTGVAMMRDGTYYEYRFNVFNPTAEPHAVRIDITGSGIGDRQPRSSRTVVVAPQTSSLVSIPQYVMEQYAPREALIFVDGAAEEKLPLGSHFQGSSYRTARDLLLGRTVNDVLPAEAAAEDSGLVAIRPAVSPASWSANWIHYTGFAAILLTPADWNELARPVQIALLRYVAAGGTLTFVGGQPAGLPVMRQITDFAPLVPAAAHGFGWVTLAPAKIDAETLEIFKAAWRVSELDRYQWAADPMTATPVPLLEDASLPLKSLFSLLVVFAVIGGPVNLGVLAKKQKRLWIFWTLPLLGIITAVILVGSVIVSEGWVRVQKTTSLTLLDERSGEAATIGWTGFYSTLAPDGEVRFDSGTEVRPLFVAGEAHTDWTDGQRFVSGWIGSRLPRSFVVRKVEPRRERLPVRREGGHLVAINGLGANVRELWVAEADGTAWVARDVAAGKEVVLTRAPNKVDPAIKDPANILTAPSMWGTLQARFAKDPRTALRAGSYVAVIERSPFVELALARPSKTSSDAVVIGIMKGIDDAS